MYILSRLQHLTAFIHFAAHIALLGHFCSLIMHSWFTFAS